MFRIHAKTFTNFFPKKKGRHLALEKKKKKGIEHLLVRTIWKATKAFGTDGVVRCITLHDVHICALVCTHGKLTNVLEPDTPGVFKKALSVEIRQLVEHYLNLNVPPREIVDKVRHPELETFRLQRQILCPNEAQKRFSESGKSRAGLLQRNMF
eukprot:jgi/Botrbrau1/13190/Bobra.0351s0003.1